MRVATATAAEALAALLAARPELRRPLAGRCEGPRRSTDSPGCLRYRCGALDVLVSLQTAADETDWLHASFSHSCSIPNYRDMCEIRTRFFRSTDVVVHVWPPVDEHYNRHPYCLHLWARLDGQRAIPDLRTPRGEV